MNIGSLYSEVVMRKLADLMIEKNGFTAVTKNGVKIRFREYCDQNPLQVSVSGRPAMRMAGEFLSEKFGSRAEDAICFAAAPAFRQALESEGAFSRFLEEMRKQEERVARKKAEAERLSRVKRLLTPEQEKQIAAAFRRIEQERIRGGGCTDECIASMVGEVAVDMLRAMGYMDIASMFNRYIPFTSANRKPVVTPILPKSNP